MFEWIREGRGESVLPGNRDVLIEEVDYLIFQDSSMGVQGLEESREFCTAAVGDRKGSPHRPM